MTRQEVIVEQRLRLALTIVYVCLATANIILKLKEKKAAAQKPVEVLQPGAADETQPKKLKQVSAQG